MSDISKKIVAACEKQWEKNKSDCSAFVRAVANDMGISLTGNADNIVDQISHPSWALLKSGSEAAQRADIGLVIAGLKGNAYGHVVIVVPGPLAHGKYPTAYWGQLGGIGKKNTTINWSWNQKDRDQVVYSWRPL